jgi:hypothetical protein
VIVSQVKLEFSNADWAVAKQGERKLTLLKKVAEDIKVMGDRVQSKTLEAMTLSELLYYALVGDGARA